MSGGHKTSAIPRPRTARTHAGDHTRLSDFTRPIAKGKQLVQRQSNRWMLALLAIVVIAALLGALFVLPVQAWLRQGDDLAAKRAQLTVLEDANSQLQVEVDRLTTPEGAKEAARDELGVVGPGEIRISMLDVESAPTRLPAGWPYDAVTQIVETRAKQAQAVPPTTPATPSAPAAEPPTATEPATDTAASSTTPSSDAATPIVDSSASTSTAPTVPDAGSTLP
jgi:cell division protein FtsB